MLKHNAKTLPTLCWVQVKMRWVNQAVCIKTLQAKAAEGSNTE